MRCRRLAARLREDVGTVLRATGGRDPANLMLFGRMSRVRAALTGKVLVSGPRPWLLPAFLRTVHMPDN